MQAAQDMHNSSNSKAYTTHRSHEQDLGLDQPPHHPTTRLWVQNAPGPYRPGHGPKGFYLQNFAVIVNVWIEIDNVRFEWFALKSMVRTHRNPTKYTHSIHKIEIKSTNAMCVCLFVGFYMFCTDLLASKNLPKTIQNACQNSPKLFQKCPNKIWKKLV